MTSAQTHGVQQIMSFTSDQSLSTAEDVGHVVTAAIASMNRTLNVPSVSDREGIHSSASSTITPVSVPPSPKKESTPSLSSRVSQNRRMNDTPTSGPSRQPLSLVHNQASQKGHLALNKFILYENRARFYVVASNTSDSRHKILKIDRTSQDVLDVNEDDMTYNGKQMSGILKMLEDGNKASGGLGKARVIFGIVGMLIDM